MAGRRQPLLLPGHPAGSLSAPPHLVTAPGSGGQVGSWPLGPPQPRGEAWERWCLSSPPPWGAAAGPAPVPRTQWDRTAPPPEGRVDGPALPTPRLQQACCPRPGPRLQAGGRSQPATALGGPRASLSTQLVTMETGPSGQHQETGGGGSQGGQGIRLGGHSLPPAGQSPQAPERGQQGSVSWEPTRAADQGLSLPLGAWDQPAPGWGRWAATVPADTSGTASPAAATLGQPPPSASAGTAAETRDRAAQRGRLAPGPPGLSELV